MKQSYNPILSIALVCILGITLYLFTLSADTPNKQVNIENIGKEHFAGHFKIQASINPEQPRVGKNQLNLIIRDKDGQLINNAKIKAVAVMPAMGSMPTMYAPAELTSEQPGFYQGQFELPMKGAWPISISIDADSQGQAQLSFDMGTSRKGLSLSSATPSTFAPQSKIQFSEPASQAKTFKVDPYRRQLIGVTTAKVTCINMTKTIHASAKISYNQTSLTDINLKFDGWIDQLKANYVGKKIKKGEILFTVYSPDLISSQDEYLQSFNRTPIGQNSIKAAAARRLSLWGINRAQVRALEKRGRPLEYLPILSPISGTIIEKNIVPGTAFTASSNLLKIADLSKVWVEGLVYQENSAQLELGMAAQVILDNKPDTPLAGKVTFIEPFLENKTRAVRVRVELPNPKGLLRPDQYVHLQLQVNLGERIVVPEQAVVFTGKNRMVFVDLGDGRLQAKKIKIGIRNNEYIEVTKGLKHGDTIVSSGNFLIASESKLKLGADQL